MDVIFKILLLTTAVTFIYGYRSEDAYLNVPDQEIFTDRSALTDKKNLQSRQYQDFLHNLYRFDKENLQKVDHLFESQTSAGNTQRHKRAIYLQPLLKYQKQILEKPRA